MELYEEKNKVKSKLPIIIGICIGILVIITVAIIYVIIYLQNTVISIYLDGQKITNIEEILYIQETEDGTKLYIPIRKIASYFNYEDYRGDYTNKSEDSTKCYVKNEFEIAMFTLDSNVLTKTRGNSDYEYIEIKEKVFEKDGELYTTIEGVEKAFNVEIATDANMKQIQIYTMDYLIQYYASMLKLTEYSTEFADKKAIFENMIIIETENKQYGVVNVIDGKSILETKYEQISYLPITKDFLVKSNNKYGIISKDTSIKVRIAYDDIKIMDNQKGFYLVKQNNLYGVIDINGKVIIPTEYKQIGLNITPYIENGVENQYVLLNKLIPIKNSEDLWGFFDINGKKITDFKFSGVGCNKVETNNGYPTLVIQSHNVIIVEKEKYYNLMTIDGEELIPNYILNSVFMKSNIETGENKFYMTYNNNQKVRSVEEWLTSIKR